MFHTLSVGFRYKQELPCPAQLNHQWKKNYQNLLIVLLQFKRYCRFVFAEGYKSAKSLYFCIFTGVKSFPLFFVVILWLIYALYYILKGNFDTNFLPTISFIKICVAENVAKSPAGLGGVHKTVNPTYGCNHRSDCFLHIIQTFWRRMVC